MFTYSNVIIGKVLVSVKLVTLSACVEEVSSACVEVSSTILLYVF